MQIQQSDYNPTNQITVLSIPFKEFISLGWWVDECGGGGHLEVVMLMEAVCASRGGSTLSAVYGQKTAEEMHQTHLLWEQRGTQRHTRVCTHVHTRARALLTKLPSDLSCS